MPVYVKPIDKVEINPLFDDICDFFGFDSEVVDDYEPELSLIQYIWQSTKQVEIYTLAPEGFPGRVKDSNSTLGSSPYVVLHTMIVHDEMFGVKKRKRDTAYMQWIRQRLINLIEGKKKPADYH
jgi:hypothetical protein